jgi:hypothetical protein
MPHQNRNPPAGDRRAPESLSAAKRDGFRSTRYRHAEQYRCLKDLLEAADAAARDRRPVVHVAQCPDCDQWLILPEHPIAVALPPADEGLRHG